MIEGLHRTLIKRPLVTVIDKLTEKLKSSGFEICALTDLDKSFKVLSHEEKRTFLLSTTIPGLFRKMTDVSSDSIGWITPCQITIHEVYPGETLLLSLSPTLFISRYINLSLIQPTLEEIDQHLMACIDDVAKEHPDALEDTSGGS